MVAKQPAPTSAVRSRGRLVRTAILLTLLITFIGLLPQLVYWTGLVGPIASYFLPGSTIEVERASLGWFTPIRIQGLFYATESRSLTLRADDVTLQRTLLDLLGSWRRLGRVRLVGLELTFAASADPAEPEPHKRPEAGALGEEFVGIEAEIEVVDGTVAFVEAVNETRTLRNVQALLSLPESNSLSLHCELAGELAEAPTSRIEGAADLRFDEQTRHPSIVQANVKAKEFPLEIANTLIRFFESNLRVSGTLTCDTFVELSLVSGEGAIKGQATVQNFSCSGDWISPDRLDLVRLDGRADLRFGSQELVISDSSIECDLGTLRGRGRMAWNEQGSTPSLEVDGNIDLAKVSQQLPRTIRLRSDVVVTGGRLVVSVRPTAEAEDRFDATIEIRDLAASYGGEPIAWNSPVTLAGRFGSHPQDSVTFDTIRCESDFLRAKGSGSLSSFDVTLACDLGKVQERAGRLLDLGGLTLAGRATARIESQRAEDQTLRIRGAARGESLDIRHAGNCIVSETLLDAQVAAIAGLGEATSLESCVVTLQAQQDKARFELRSPIDDWRQSWGAWSLKGEGDLASMLRRAEPWTGKLADWTFAGSSDFSGVVAFESDRTTIDSVEVALHQVTATAEGVHVVEPDVRITGALQWNADSSFTLSARSVSGGGLIQVDAFEGRFTQDGLQARGRGAVDLDVARIRSWTVEQLSQVDVGGRLVSQFSVRSMHERWTWEVTGRIDNARYGAGPEPVILEPKVELAGTVEMEFEAQTKLLVDNLRLALPGLAIVAKGSLQDPASTQELVLDGVCEYDLAALTPRLQRWLGNGVSFAGQERRSFHVAGRLSGPQAELAFTSAPDQSSQGRFPHLVGELSVGWQCANLYGFVAGPAVLEGVFDKSWLTTKPAQFSLSGGKAVLQPRVFFAADATYLTHPGGLIADHVQVTREMCDASLQYIAPALARSVDVAGSISMKAGQVKIPLGSLDKADFAGKLVIHHVKATGGPMVRELIVLTEGQPILEIAKESEVPFRVTNNRVYHENLQMRLPGILVKTSGSVGFDGSMALVVETPIPKRWIGTPAIAKKVEGQTIKIPIGGTLDEPRLDRKALQKEIGRFVQKGAGAVIEDKINQEINKQLDKLFPGLK